MRGRVSAFAAAGLVLTVVLGGMGARADHSAVTDPRDTRGLLDLRSARLETEVLAVWRLKTYRFWTVRRIHDHGYFVIELDTKDDQRRDYYVLLRSNGFKMVGTLWRERRHRSDVRLATLAVYKLDRVVQVEVPLDEIVFERLTYRWKAISLMTGPRCPRVCIDDAPDFQYVEEPKPGFTPPPVSPLPPASPSPTPSPSESPEPTPSPT